MSNFVDLNKYNPDTLNPFDLETQKSAIILCVLNSHTRETELNKIIEAYTAAFQTEESVALLILRRSFAQLSESAVMTVLANHEQENSPDILFLQEEVVPEPEFLRNLLGSCQYFIDYSEKTDYDSVLCSFSMNHQVLILDTPENRSQFNGLPVIYVENSIHACAELLRQVVLGQIETTHTRSELIYHISQANVNWSHPWLQDNLDAIIAHLNNIKIVSIVFWGRSGSTFIHSLLDNHPEILSIGPANFATVMEYPHIWTLILNRKPLSFNDIIESFCELLDKDSGVGISREIYLFSKENAKFKALFICFCHQIINQIANSNYKSQLESEPRKLFFLIIHFAYALALGQDVRQKHVIAHQLHWVEDLVGLYKLLEDFPDLKMLGMSRHPVQGIYSSIQHSVKEQQRIEPNYSTSEMVFSGFYINKYRHILMGWRRAQLLLKEPVYNIRLEQLHRHPEQTLTALCRWMDIKWNSRLLESTQDGKPYAVLSGVHVQIDQFSQVFDPERVEYASWKNKLNEVDKFVLEGLLQKDLNKQGLEYIPDFKRNLSYLLMFLPTQIEWEALQLALSLSDFNKLKMTVLSVLERYLYSWLFICHFLFPVDPGLRSLQNSVEDTETRTA